MLIYVFLPLIKVSHVYIKFYIYINTYFFIIYINIGDHCIDAGVLHWP